LWQADLSSRGVPWECGVSECDHEARIMRRPWPTRGCCSIGVVFKNCEYILQYVQQVRKRGEDSGILVRGASVIYMNGSGMY
jgi:hypothetical protein